MRYLSFVKKGRLQVIKWLEVSPFQFRIGLRVWFQQASLLITDFQAYRRVLLKRKLAVINSIGRNLMLRNLFKLFFI